MFEYYLPGSSIDCRDAPVGDDGSDAREHHETESNVVIIVGANGSGKSKLGAWLERQDQDHVHRIVAQRKLNPSEFTPLKSFEVAENRVRFGADSRSDKRYNKWSGATETTKLVDDFDNTLAGLLAERNNISNAFREDCSKADAAGKPHPPTPLAKLDCLFEIWSSIFPHRGLKERDSKFYAEVNVGGENRQYPAAKMSDGERSVLYLAAQVLCVPEVTTFIIDEPEVHLHGSIMSQLWSALEDARPDCLFVYITHDVEFAATRQTSDRYWIRGYDGERWRIERIETEGFPESLLLEILGNRKSVLFVEGDQGSLDSKLYSVLFPERYVVPCGSCASVLERTKAFRALSSWHLLDAVGLIDRDFRSEEELASYARHGIYALEVAEVENLFIVPGVLDAVFSHLEFDAAHKRAEAESRVRSVLEKDFTVQVGAAVMSEVKHMLTMANIDRDDMEGSLQRAVQNIDIPAMQRCATKRLRGVIDNCDYAGALRIANTKGLVPEVGKVFDMKGGRFPDLVLRLMRGSQKEALRDAMKPYLPEQLRDEVGDRMMQLEIDESGGA